MGIDGPDQKNWLQELLDELGWKQADLVRESGMKSSVISNVINGHRNAGVDFCLIVATATHRPDVEILRRAKIISQISEADQDTETGRHQLQLMTPAERKRAIKLLEFIVQEEAKREDHAKPDKRAAPSDEDTS